MSAYIYVNLVEDAVHKKLSLVSSETSIKHPSAKFKIQETDSHR